MKYVGLFRTWSAQSIEKFIMTLLTSAICIWQGLTRGPDIELEAENNSMSCNLEIFWIQEMCSKQ